MEIVLGELMATGLSPEAALDMTYPAARATLKAIHAREKRLIEVLAASAGMKI